jgi:signal transduction histidine kinase
MRDSDATKTRTIGPEAVGGAVSDIHVPDWQSIVDAIDISISVFDTDDRLVAWNRAFAETTGQPAHEFEVGMSHLAVIEAFAERGLYGPGDPKEVAERRLAKIRENRVVGAPEEIALGHNMYRARKRFWLEDGSIIALTRNRDNEDDVEHELAAKSVILQTVFDTLSQPICVWDGEQRLVACNEQFAETLGFRPGDLEVGMPASDLILASARLGYLGAGDPEELAQSRYYEIWRDAPPEHEVIRRSGGRTFDVHRGHLPDGGVVSVFNDVTERDRAAAELRDAKAQAENANSVKSDFLANMSHELRTPLNAIIGFAEMMMHSRFQDPAKYQEYAGDIRGSAVLLLNIINDLLDLSRIEAGKTEFRLTTLDLGDCVETCLDLIRRMDGAAGLTIESRIPAEFPEVQSDENFLRQSLLNLLSNAVKATPDGGRITVAAERTGDNRFDLTVSDTGIGMPPEMIETVFNPYDGSGNSYVRKEKGTGLGLSIVKRLVEMLRGTVAIESTSGEGTTVQLDLPIRYMD